MAAPPRQASSDPRMRTQVVGPTLAYIRSTGLDPTPLIERFGLPEGAEHDPEFPVALSTLQAFYEKAERFSGDRFLGVHSALHMPRGSFGLVEFICRSAPTIGEVLTRLSRYTSLLTELILITATRVPGPPGLGDEVIVEHKIPGHRLCVGRHGNEFFLTMFMRHARLFSAQPVVPRRAWLAHPEPADVSELRPILGDDLRFDAGSNGLALDARVLDLPVGSHDAALFAVLRAQAEEALARLETAGAPPGSDDLLRLVHRQIHVALPDGAPDLALVAKAMGQSARTLQRRLTEKGTSFQRELDAARRDLAQALVADARLPLGEITFRLGYAEVSAFLKAFKRWTGSTPTRFRQS